MSGNLENAIENMDDEKRLFELCNMGLLNSNLKRIALRNPNLAKNQNFLMKIILNESDFSVGEYAIEILLEGKSDEEKQEFLFEIVNNAENFDIAYSALKLLRNRDFLMQTALNTDNPSEIRSQSIQMIYEPVGCDEHQDIFLKDDDWRVRCAIITLGTNEHTLIDIINNDKDNRVRNKALKTIENDNFLYDFALSQDNLPLVFTAINQMYDEKLVRKIRDVSDDELIKACAQDRLDFIEPGPSALFSF